MLLKDNIQRLSALLKSSVILFIVSMNHHNLFPELFSDNQHDLKPFPCMEWYRQMLNAHALNIIFYDYRGYLKLYHYFLLTEEPSLQTHTSVNLYEF